MDPIEQSAAATKLAKPDGAPDFSTFLVAQGVLDAATVERAQRAARASGEALEIVLPRLGLIPEDRLADLMAEHWRMPRLSFADLPDDPLATPAVEPSFILTSRLLPVADTETGFVVATDQPFRADAEAALSYALEKSVNRIVCTPAEWERAYERLYGAPASGDAQTVAIASNDEIDVDRLRDIASEAPIVRLVAQIISIAVSERASDIHIEPSANDVSVRYRIDGELRLARMVPEQLRAAITSRIKIMARLDIAERRLPQDGRIRMAVRGVDIDFRISTLPTAHGEGIVLRVLDRSQVTFDYRQLGFDPETVAAFRGLAGKPNGIVLVTGPTGSGKTTTLYTALGELDSDALKIITVEDPIEYQIEGVTQVQVQPQIGLDFPTTLRAILRHNPNVVTIGEIRDLETARIAVQASLTGHLVLSTLHTNSAAATVMRLLDMGIEDYLLASTLQGVMGQRLVRRLCGACAEPHEEAEAWRKRLDAPRSARILQPRGCSRCGGTGYAGRRAIAECMIVTPELRRALMDTRSEAAILACARKAGFSTLHENGLQAVWRGETSIEEVTRATEAI
jgi:general secretion pathway protein E